MKNSVRVGCAANRSEKSRLSDSVGRVVKNSRSPTRMVTRLDVIADGAGEGGAGGGRELNGGGASSVDLGC